MTIENCIIREFHPFPLKIAQNVTSVSLSSFLETETECTAKLLNYLDSLFPTFH